MRNTADLVKEMLKEADGAYLVAIAVGFENDTIFIVSTDRRALSELNAAVRIGGSPIGLLRFVKEKDGIQGSYRPFDEYADQLWAASFLADLLQHSGEIIALGRQKALAPSHKEISRAG